MNIEYLLIHVGILLFFYQSFIHDYLVHICQVYSYRVFNAIIIASWFYLSNSNCQLLVHRKGTDFRTFILCPETLLSFAHQLQEHVCDLGFSTQVILSTVNKEFCIFLPNPYGFGFLFLFYCTGQNFQFNAVYQWCFHHLVPKLNEKGTSSHQ